MTTLFVAVGGMLGVLARFGIGRLTLHHEQLLWSTAAINIAGSFLLGLLVAEHWYVALSVIGGLAAAAAGYALGRRLA